MTIAPVTSADDFEQVRAIRTEVFIEEQECPPEEEWDGHDDTARHVLARLEDGTPVGTARWRTVPHDEGLAAKLERFAVRAPHRGEGIGTLLVQYVMEDARQAGFETQKLHAQARLETYYARFGFVSTGERFTEAGIPHVAMVRTGTSSSAKRSGSSLAVGGTGEASS
ncbi:MAG: GNAT family N-acetyltransferase [Longimonas sp.]|uniref:GNAT family N-acetyltransferase n=1 Tax=Longimonas sp. TaxID=2039626 RepID=UPI00334B9824